MNGERTKHIDIKYCFITDTIEKGTVKLQWIPSREQQADIFYEGIGCANIFGIARTFNDTLKFTKNFFAENC